MIYSKNASLEQINEESLSQPKLKKQNKSEANVDKKREKNIKNSESMRSKPKEKGVCKSVMDKQSRDRKAKGKNIEIIVDEQGKLSFLPLT